MGKLSQFKRERGLEIDIGLLIAGSVLMAFMGAASVNFGLAASTCWARWHITTYEFRTTLTGQCMVKHPDYGWLPENKIRFGVEK